jgi:hypothetical protein
VYLEDASVTRDRGDCGVKSARWVQGTVRAEVTDKFRATLCTSFISTRRCRVSIRGSVKVAERVVSGQGNCVAFIGVIWCFSVCIMCL